MPGSTATRGYPYPTDTDPIDVAGDVQALAEAIDVDAAASVAAQAVSWAEASFNTPLIPPSAAHCSMTLTRSAHWTAQDAWSITTDVPGLYIVTANVLKSGTAASVNNYMGVEVRLFSWADVMVPKQVVGGVAPMATYWVSTTVSGVFQIDAGNWLRVAVGGDAGGAIDSRSTLQVARVSSLVSPTFISTAALDPPPLPLDGIDMSGPAGDAQG